MMLTKKILFILCPPVWDKTPPLGPAILAETVLNAGHQAAFFDLNVKLVRSLGKDYRKDWTTNRSYITREFYLECFARCRVVFDELLQLAGSGGFDFIGFTVFKSNRNFTLELCGWLREKIPSLRLIFGGPEVFAMKLENDPAVPADYLVVGEGEKSLLSILNETAESRWMDFDPPDEINFFPKYHAFDLSLYSKGRLPVLAGRGCVNQCRFCTERLLYQKYRMRKPENILEEINYHYQNHAVRHFIFFDSIFNALPSEVEKLLDLIITGGLKITWEAQIYIRNQMADRLLQKMKDSGCVNLFIGLESGSRKVLELMNKGFHPEDAVRFFQRLNEHRLQFEVSLIANYPGETAVELEETIEFIKQNRAIIPKIAQISVFREYPGNTAAIPIHYREANGVKRVKRLLETVRECGIPYTPSYIDNLI